MQRLWIVKQDKILPRTHIQINDNINDFVLLEQSGELVACAGLKNCQAGGMGEIYALAVSEKAQNQGISTQLLDKVNQFQDFLCCIQLCI
jgi:amino-acid N-acetyltransferase